MSPIDPISPIAFTPNMTWRPIHDCLRFLPTAGNPRGRDHCDLHGSARSQGHKFIAQATVMLWRGSGRTGEVVEMCFNWEHKMAVLFKLYEQCGVQ